MGLFYFVAGSLITLLVAWYFRPKPSLTDQEKTKVNRLIEAYKRDGWEKHTEVHYKDAVKLFRKAAQFIKLEQDPERWAEIQHALAFALNADGQYKETIAILREVIDIREKLFGLEHPNTLTSRNNLAKVLGSQNKYAEAEAELRAVLEVKEKVLGAEHPSALLSRHNLAYVLKLQCKLAEAEAECRKTLLGLEKVLGPDHPNTVDTRNLLIQLTQP